MNWTTTPPTEPGWYLWKRRGYSVSNADLLLLVERDDERVRGLRVAGYHDYFNRTARSLRGEWIGPVPE